MKLRLVKYRKFLFISSLSISSLIFNSVPSFAQDMSDPEDATFSCSSAVNVMDCINQTQAARLTAADPKSLIINGLNNQSHAITGPVSLNVRYDDQLSWIIDGAYAEKFGNRFAIGLKGSYGPNEYRGNATLGFGIAPNQQFKLTYEYLAQNLPFEFTSGNVNEWVNQNAFGGAYRYMFADNKFLKGVEVSGSYTKANSKELSDIDSYDANGNVTQIDQRRIAGGQQQNGLASVILTPFKYTIIKAGAGYSASSFDTKWDSNQSQSSIAYNVEASHLLTPKTLISTSVNNTSASRSHSLKVSRILPANLEGTLGAQYNISHVDGISNNGNITVGLSYPAPKAYTNIFSGSLGDLKAWVQQPAVYNARVLAIAEERIIQTQIGVKPIPDTSIPVNDNITQVVTINTKDYFTFDPNAFTDMKYTIATYQADGKTPVNLNLQMQADTGFNWIVGSSAPMPASALVNGVSTSYVGVITANGIRNGVTINVATNKFTINAAQNPDVPAAQWGDNTTLKAVNPGSSYDSGSLDSYVKGLDGETYQFSLKDTEQNKNPSWLSIKDGKSITGIPPANFTGANVTLQAVSMVSNRPVTNPDIQTLTLPLATTYNPPQWNASTSQLPQGINGILYDINLNPYLNDTYLTQTTNGVATVQDVLKFDLVTGQQACGDWLHFNKDAQTEHNGEAGELTGTPPDNAGDSCYVYVQVTSQVANTTYTLPARKIPLRPASYTAPNWKTNLPNFGSGTSVTINLNPYDITDGDAYLSKTYNNDTKQDVEDDVLSQFAGNTKITCNGLDSSLFTVYDNGIIKSNNNIPANAQGSCTIIPKFYSKTMGRMTNDSDNITGRTFTINDSTPRWTDNNPIVNLSYNTDNNQGDFNTSYKINITSYLQEASKNAKLSPPKNVQALPLGGGTNLTTQVLSDNNTYVIIQAPYPGPDEVVSEGSTSDSQGKFTITATSPDSGLSQDATFTYQITGTFNNPIYKNGDFSSNISPANAGDNTYSVIINPYKSGAIDYLKKTQLVYSTSTGKQYADVSDTLAFALDTTASSGNDSCQWAQIDSEGTISVKSGQFPQASNGVDCTFYFTVTSKKNGNKTTNLAAKIPVNVTPPQWIADGKTDEIYFDTVDPTVSAQCGGSGVPACINLTSKITNDYSGQGVIFSVSKHNWAVMTTGSGVNQVAYLVRTTTTTLDGSKVIDATDISDDAADVTVTATNQYGGASTATLKVKVLPHPQNVNVTWVNGTALKTTQQTNQSQDIDLGSHFVTKIKSGSLADTIISDNLYMSLDKPITTTFTGKSINATQKSNQYYITVPALQANDYGVYPNISNTSGGTNQLVLTDFYTQSQGESYKTTLDLASKYGVTLTMGTLGWTEDNVSKTLYFDAIAGLDVKYGPSPSCEDKCGINLSKLLNFVPTNKGLSNLQMVVTPVEGNSYNTSEDWDVIPDNSDPATFYLVRKAKTKDGYSKKYLDGNVIQSSNSQMQLKIIAKSDNMDASNPLTLNVTVVADDRAGINRPFIFGWDDGAPQYGQGLSLTINDTLNVAGTSTKQVRLTGTYSDNNLIKLCSRPKGADAGNTICGDTVVTGVTISVPVYSTSTGTVDRGGPLGVTNENGSMLSCSERIMTQGETGAKNIGFVYDAPLSNSNNKSDIYLGIGKGQNINCFMDSMDNFPITNKETGHTYTINFQSITFASNNNNKVLTESYVQSGGSGDIVFTLKNWLKIS